MYKINNSLKTIIYDLEKSLNNDCLISALALALIIPDICGKVKYPEIKTNGERYRKRYDEYIGNREKDGLTCNANEAFCGMPYLSGEVVYKLRCAFLHSGSSNIENEYEGFKLDNFVLRIEKKNDFDIYSDESSLDGDTNLSSYVVNIRRLCCILMWAGKSFLKNETEETLKRLETLKIQIFD